MRNIREFLTIIFRDLSAQDILNQTYDTGYNNLDTPLIMNLMEQRLKHYSISELKMLQAYLIRECGNMREAYESGMVYPPEFENTDNRKQILDRRPQNRGPLNVFALITYYALHVLDLSKSEKNDLSNLTVQFEKLLHWKDLSYVLSEDVLIAAAVARDDRYHSPHSVRKKFNWATVLGNNNAEITKIMYEGVCENHFHLKGSGPAYLLTWPYLMNYFITGDKAKDNQNIRNIKEMEDVSRNASYHVSVKQNEASLFDQLIQAAAIRFYLYCKINDLPYADMLLRKEGNNLEYILGEMVTSTDVEEKKAINKAINIDGILKLKKEFIANKEECLQEEKAEDILDYTLIYKNRNGKFVRNADEEDYEGERRFLYQCFRVMKPDGIYNKKFSPKDKKLFLAYLLIRERFRVEFLQVNRDISGFENFNVFELRKDIFTDHIKDGSQKIIRAAFRDCLSIPGMKKLEARISPKESAEDYREKRIKNCDACLSDEDKDKVRYVVHFVKKSDTFMDDLRTEVLGRGRPRKHQKSLADSPIEYRNRDRRVLWRVQADALKEFRESSNPEVAKRVVGIDACNFEMFCRPEVGSQVFRDLRSHQVEGLDNLHVTYHVGEAFLDIANGLRAIDEAIRFLDMQSGDRLGHALALGVDVERWYEKKYHLMIPLQEHLDNIMWLYYIMVESNLNDSFKEERDALLNQFVQYFYILFCDRSGNVDYDDRFLDGILYKDKAELMDIYHRSWLLRKEDPRKYYEEAKTLISKYRKNSNLAFNETVKIDGKDYEDRLEGILQVRSDDVTDEADRLAIMLNAMYHYDNYTKLTGMEPIELNIKNTYVQLIKYVQIMMQKKVKEMDIRIEANPTSNYLISTFEFYDKHPIISWYNIDLVQSMEERMKSQQLHVSINTDDAGVFSTRMDNEYALMALALKRVVNKDGKPLYDDQAIYKWLRNIRDMGLQQSFFKTQEEFPS